MTPLKALTGAALAAVAVGCVHFGETDYPAVTIPSLPADRPVRVQLAGFDAMITTYVPVYGSATVINGSAWYGPHGPWHGGPYATTVATETLIPQATPTTAFRDRATDALERCGCLLQAPDPQYRVEVAFHGPCVTDGDVWAECAWNLFTLLTADYAGQGWAAKLKIHDVKTGRLVFFRDYEQRYEVKVWGPIPIFCPGASQKTKFSAGQCWCLTALTDRALADAMTFFTQKETKK